MRADAREKRRAILTSAWHLISERGAEVPMRAVARDAGVGDATFYRHFPTPEDLIVGLLEEVFERVAGVIESHDDAWSADPAAAWSATVRDLSRLRFGALAYQIGPLTLESDELRQHILPARERTVDLMSQLLERAADAQLVDRDLDIERFFVGLAVNSRPLPAAVEEMLPGQADWLAEVYVRGLRPSG